jgi:hypothetical protein
MDRTAIHARKKRRSRFLLAAGIAVTSVAWLSLRAAPPLTGRALFGLWHVSDIAVACGLVSAALLASCASRRGVLRFLLAGCSGLLTWLCLEAVFLARGPALPAKALGAERLPGCDIESETVPDTALAFGLPCSPVPFRYTTNSSGYRNPPDRDRGTVYCVGDSCLVGALLDWRDTIVHQLETRLAKPCVNVALVGLAPQEAQAEFEHATAGQDLQGRVVLQFLCEDNDLLDSARVTGPPGAETGPSLWERSLLHRAVIELQRLTQPVVAETARRTGLFGDTPVRFLWHHDRGDTCEQQWPAIERSLDTFRAAIEARGGRFGVALIPQKLRVLGPFCRFMPGSDLLPLADHLTPMPGRLTEWSQRSGTAVLDLTEALQCEARTNKLVWFADDTHWSAAGAAAAAAAVAAWPWLQQQLAPPAAQQR